MTTIRKYGEFVSRAALLAGYILLFAVHSNYRFFDVANFFDYHDCSRMNVAAVHGQTCTQVENVPFRSHLNPEKSAHLGIDKRFSAKHSYKLPENSYSHVVACETIEREYALLLKVYSSSDLPTNALRGPPIA